MTTPITKEQLIARIETQKETALKHPDCSVALMDLEIANIALAAMDAEPVADVVAWSHPNHPDVTCNVRLRRFDLAPGPLFAVAQPVAVVPDDISGPLAHAYKELTPTFIRNHIAVFERYGITPNDSSTVIQALRIALDGIERRAAMLKHSENERDMVERVSQPYKLPSQSSDSVNEAAWKLHDTLTEHGPLNGHQFNNLKGCFYEALKVALRNSPVIPDGWVACSERMPDCDYVLAADFSGKQYPANMPNIQIGIYADWFGDGSSCWDDGDGNYLHLKQVTHWMPLPAAPQQEVK